VVPRANSDCKWTGLGDQIGAAGIGAAAECELEVQSGAGQGKTDPRTTEATWRGIGTLPDRFKPEECANYLVNAGYASA
jgi:hypothetical protein